MTDVPSLPAHLVVLCLVYMPAALVGFAYMLMELVWYRMLAPILGGTTFTFGLILTFALLGIGLGGALYPLVFRRREPSLHVLTWMCAVEALCIAVPLALGDRLASWLVLYGRDVTGFSSLVAGWSAVALVVVLPASIVSGLQFPVMIALLGRAKQGVGRQVGWIYAANMLGGIAGSLAGGFGLLPLFSAPHVWRLVVVLLAALSGWLVLAPPGKGSAACEGPSHWALQALPCCCRAPPAPPWSGVTAGLGQAA